MQSLKFVEKNNNNRCILRGNYEKFARVCFYFFPRLHGTVGGREKRAATSTND